MIKLAVVLLAFTLITVCNNFYADWYYLAYSASYGIVSIIAAIFYQKTNSKLLLCYSTVSLLTSVLHFLVHVGFYDTLKNMLWHQPLNVGVIVESFELMLVITGSLSVAIYVYNLFINNHNQRKNSIDSVGLFK